MDLNELRPRLAWIANQIKDEDDPDIIAVHVVLCALLGSIDPVVTPHLLEEIARHAGMMCLEQLEDAG